MTTKFLSFLLNLKIYTEKLLHKNISVSSPSTSPITMNSIIQASFAKNGILISNRIIHETSITHTQDVSVFKFSNITPCINI